MRHIGKYNTSPIVLLGHTNPNGGGSRMVAFVEIEKLSSTERLFLLQQFGLFYKSSRLLDELNKLSMPVMGRNVNAGSYFMGIAETRPFHDVSFSDREQTLAWDNGNLSRFDPTLPEDSAVLNEFRSYAGVAQVLPTASQNAPNATPAAQEAAPMRREAAPVVETVSKEAYDELYGIITKQGKQLGDMTKAIRSLQRELKKAGVTVEKTLEPAK